MTKAELIKDISAKMGVGKRAAEMALHDVFYVIKDHLNQWQDVRIPGFGTFKADLRPARWGRNPKTGEAIRIPPKKVIKFKASKNL